MTRISVWPASLLMILLFSFCKEKPTLRNTELKIRKFVDTVGFAHLDWQVDSVVSRINSQFHEQLKNTKQDNDLLWRAAICPHDDYTYASWLYPAVLKNVKSKTVILFGVAHKAALFHLENRIVFDRFDAWKGPYGNVTVSPLRDKIIEKLPEDLFVVHDSMQIVEHSVESMIPFLQHQNPEVEIISILVPYMSLSKMDTISSYLAKAINAVANDNNLEWGKDFSILITTDAVHYGDEEWGGQNYALFGTDSLGTEKAREKEKEIIDHCFTGVLTDEKVNHFVRITVQEDDFRQYKWTWCGRYSVPLGLKTANNLRLEQNEEPLNGILLGYQTTIDHPELPVKDLRMGKTAVATMHHWVGFTSIGFK